MSRVCLLYSSTRYSLTHLTLLTHSPNLTHSLKLLFPHLLHSDTTVDDEGFGGDVKLKFTLNRKGNDSNGNLKAQDTDLVKEKKKKSSGSQAQGNAVKRSVTHSLSHSLTYSLTHSLTHSLTDSLTHSLTHSLTQEASYRLHAGRWL
jgi:hypothetical protein